MREGASQTGKGAGELQWLSPLSEQKKQMLFGYGPGVREVMMGSKSPMVSPGMYVQSIEREVLYSYADRYAKICT